MARPPTGSVRERQLAADGAGIERTAYDVRFSLPRAHYPNPPRRRIELCLGTTPDWSRPRAEVVLSRILEQVAIGAWVDPKSIIPAEEPAVVLDPTFHIVVSQWWAKNKRGLDEDTVKDYYHWRIRKWLLPKWKDWPVSTIDAAAIDAWVTEIARDEEAEKAGLSAESVNKILNILERTLDLARDYKYGGMENRPNPASGKNRKAREKNKGKEAREATWLNYDQLMLLVEAAGQLEREAKRYKVLGRAEMMLVFFLCGLRASELCALKWSDIDLTLGILTVGKAKTASGTGRPVPMPHILIRALREWKLRSPRSRNRDWVFPTASRSGKLEPLSTHPRTRHSVRQRVLAPVLIRAKSLADEADIAIPEALSTHAGRRSCVTYLVACNIDVGNVQEIIGHEDARTTMGIYRQRQYLKADKRYRTLMHGPNEVLADLVPDAARRQKAS
jgi:integrase